MLENVLLLTFTIPVIYCSLLRVTQHIIRLCSTQQHSMSDMAPYMQLR